MGSQLVDQMMLRAPYSLGKHAPDWAGIVSYRIKHAQSSCLLVPAVRGLCTRPNGSGLGGDGRLPDPLPHIIEPMPFAVGLALGAAAGILPPASWGLLGQAVTAAPLAMFLDGSCQAAWTSYQITQYIKDQSAEYGDDWEVPDEGMAVGVDGRPLGVVMALVVVIARTAYEQAEQPKILGELFAEARTVRALETRLEVHEQTVRELRSEIASLR